MVMMRLPACGGQTLNLFQAAQHPAAGALPGVVLTLECSSSSVVMPKANAKRTAISAESLSRSVS